MDTAMQTNFNNLESEDKNQQYEAFMNIIEATKKEVDWAYEVWDELLAGLTSTDNHKRSRYAQFLANLAISDPEKRMLTDFSAVWEVTKDKRTVTARHSLQAIWRIALAGEEQKEMVVNQLVERFETCEGGKNYTLVRFDIIQDLRNLYDEIKEQKVKEIALGLIEKEEDPKYQKKYAKVWKNA
ncbi:hypothetical protein [Oceanobacillus chungangensis]|uniref:HEAT repeat domain-containing protein n=1 Tax=Oceanobacillus chungangensis TaxID=1229152 RepID=A0A3D8PMB0_9BACI|nr:hypothetical protein [Oceanobacillus chungangensis]RDW16647.1 hypothetical protein CWR45_13505 [Oceanobacillus chungangensis]